MTKFIKTTAAMLAIATTIAAVSTVATPTVAEAKNGRNAAFAAGVIGGVLAGALLSGGRHHGPAYVETCGWRKVKVWDAYRHRYVWAKRRVCW